MSQPEILRYDIPDELSAALIPGRKRPIHGKPGAIHCADALLIWREVPVIAVADAPERNPAASSSFLKRFSDALSASPIRFGQHPVGDSLAAVVELVTALIRTVDYHDSTTFSAVIPVAEGGRLFGIVLHAGDSLILRIKRESGAVTQVSRTSHVVVGRAPALFQTEVIPLTPDDLIVLGSDGITDLARTHGAVPAALLSSKDAARNPSGIVSYVVDSAARASVRLDDIAAVCAAAGALAVPIDGPAGAPVILT